MNLQLVLYGVLLFAGVVMMSIYFYRTWTRRAGLEASWWQRALVVLIVSAPMVALGMRAAYGYNLVTIGVSWAGWFVGGCVFLLLAFYLFRDAIGCGVGYYRRHTDQPLDPEKRRLFVRTTNVALGGVAVVVAANGVRAARKTPAVKRVKIPVKSLPSAFSEMSIVQLSDIHLGDTIGKGFLRRVVKRTMSINPDMIVITGDLVDGTVRDIGSLLQPLEKLSAPLGVYFVTGNHEYYFEDARAWVDEIEKYGVTPLVNQSKILSFYGQSFVLGGITDHDAGHFIHAHRPDVDGTFQGTSTTLPRILLAHQPRSLSLARGHHVDVQLSGHTHGGQIWPFGWLVSLQQRFSAGLHQVEDGGYIYISRGTGYWGPPMRVGASSEITHIQLIPLRDAETEN